LNGASSTLKYVRVWNDCCQQFNATLVYVLAAEKIKFSELIIPLFLVVFGNNLGKMEVTMYIDGVAYKN
jgi:hypothetical protein